MVAAGVALLAIAVLTMAIGLAQLAQGDAGRGPLAGRAVAPQGDQRSAGGVGPVAGASTPAARPVVRLPGPTPQEGTARFAFAAGGGPLLGRAGTVLRFRIAVEEGSQEQVDPVADLVDVTLGDARSWTGDGRTRMQRVSARQPADFTIYLATARTAARMCSAGGVDIQVDGQPYTSCRAPGQVIINLNRWRESVPEYVRLGVPLQEYRQYVLNHEVGHELGQGHEQCPGPGRAAPVMLQQTLSLRGCQPYSWPRLDGQRYAGPADS